MGGESGHYFQVDMMVGEIWDEKAADTLVSKGLGSEPLPQVLAVWPQANISLMFRVLLGE